MNIIQKFKEFFTPSKVKELEEKVNQLQRNAIQNVLQPIKTGSDFDIDKKDEKLISKILYNINTKNIDVILSNGNVLSGVVEKEVYAQIKECNDELVLVNLLSPPKEAKQLEIDFEKEVQETITPLIDILSTNDNFEIEGDKVYLKGIKSIAIPNSIVGEFIRLQSELDYYEINQLDNLILFNIPLEKLKEEFNALLMFTFWLLLNPVESSRNDCLNFVKKNNIPITKNGMLVTFRKVVSKGEENKELVKFISESFFKTKKNKKSPKNYEIYDNNGFVLIQKDKKHNFNNYKGNLADLYLNLTNLEENIFTDNHTKSKSIKIGEVYKEDEDKIDLDNNISCSAGLHSGGLTFGFSGFGDTDIICLCNPMKVRSVPIADCSKMRSSELLPIAIVDFNNYKKFVETNEIINLSDNYFNETMEDLKIILKEKKFEKLTCQKELFDLTPKEIVNIVEILNNRIIKV